MWRAPSPGVITEARIAASPHTTIVDGEYDAHDLGVLLPGTLVGSYRIEQQIAEGGMGIVYEAAHTALPRRAAIKVMHRFLLGRWASRERLFLEARILDSLDHPGLVRLYDAGLLPDERPWLAMELLDGVTLAQRIVVHGSLDPLEVVEVLVKVAAALDTAHAHGIVHRDLKPDNVILVRRNGALVCKVIDWGIACSADDGGGRLTRADATPGTPFYMSPEQARGQAVDGRSDLYTLAVIAHEALTGHLPFEADSPVEVMIQHLHAEPPRLRDRIAGLPPALDDLLQAMMAKVPARRPSMNVVMQRLHEIAADLRTVECSLEMECDVADSGPQITTRTRSRLLG